MKWDIYWTETVAKWYIYIYFTNLMLL